MKRQRKNILKVERNYKDERKMVEMEQDEKHKRQEKILEANRLKHK